MEVMERPSLFYIVGLIHDMNNDIIVLWFCTFLCLYIKQQKERYKWSKVIGAVPCIYASGGIHNHLVQYIATQ